MNNSAGLEHLFDFIDTNERYLNELVELIPKNQVVPFVGAGLSVPIYPTWNKFFSDVLSMDTLRPKSKIEIEELLLDKKYEKAASVLGKSLGCAVYTGIIKDIFSEITMTNKNDELDNMPISILPHIFKNNKVITTNFDRLLSKVFEREGHPFKDYLTYYTDSSTAQGDFQQGLENYLLKLHGDYAHTDKIVFTEEQYNECYGENLDSSYVSFLADVLSSKVLLFLGCSMDVDRTTHLLEKIALCKTRTHYALLEATSVGVCDKFDDIFYDKAQRLSNMGIKCIWYPKGKHEFVYSALDEIKKN